MPDSGKIPAARIVVVMPNWLGDAVMATPFLRALRGVYPEAHIAAVARGIAVDVCQGLVDAVQVVGKEEEGKASRWMRGRRFDLGVLLPNSFRSAWMLWRGGVKRRLGYARDRRSWLLTDRVPAPRKSMEQKQKDEGTRTAIALLEKWEPISDGDLLRVDVEGRGFTQRYFVECRTHSTGQIVRTKRMAVPRSRLKILEADYQPVPTIDYYLALARSLGAAEPDRCMTLLTAPADAADAQATLAALGMDHSPLVVIVPGANFGASKCWMPERFAAVAEQLADPAGPFAARVPLAGSPGETPVCQAIHAAMKTHRDRTAILSSLSAGQGVSIGTLKGIIQKTRLMICNDTGPRHIAAAFGVPTVTLFGPTDPVWAETYSAVERIARVDVPCGPCQLRQCPIDHRCMKAITPEMVLAAARELWGLKR